MTKKGGLDLCKQYIFGQRRLMFVLVLMLTVSAFMPLSMSGAAEQAAVTLLPLHEEYHPGEIITIAGTSIFQTVTLKMIGPDLSRIFYVDVLKVDEHHTFQTQIRLPDDIAFGSYTIVVGVNKEIAQATFTVKTKQNDSPAPAPSPSPIQPQEPIPTPQNPPASVIEEKTVSFKDGQATIKTYADQSRKIVIEMKSDNLQQALNQGAQTITLEMKNIELKANDQVNISIPASIANELVTKKTNVTLALSLLTIGIPGEVLSSFIDAQNAISMKVHIKKIDHGTVKIAAIENIQALTMEYTLEGNKPLPKPVTLSFDVAESGYDLRKALIYNKDATTGLWKAIPDQSRDGRSFIGKARVFGSYAVLIVQKTFSDIQKHWGKDAIEVLASRGVVSGVDLDHFQPERFVTRAEFAALMLKAFHLDQEKHPSPFQDVPSTAWYNEVVGTAYYYGIMKGDGKHFRPNDPITREEMAVVIVNAARAFDSKIVDLKGHTVPSASNLTSFADFTQISAWAKDAVAQAQAQGWVNGLDDKRFAPKQYTKRAEAATVVYRLVVGL